LGRVAVEGEADGLRIAIVLGDGVAARVVHSMVTILQLCLVNFTASRKTVKICTRNYCGDSERGVVSSVSKGHTRFVNWIQGPLKKKISFCVLSAHVEDQNFRFIVLRRDFVKLCSMPAALTPGHEWDGGLESHALVSELPFLFTFNSYLRRYF
jgi:hypothetical protein